VSESEAPNRPLPRVSRRRAILTTVAVLLGWFALQQSPWLDVSIDEARRRLDAVLNRIIDAQRDRRDWDAVAASAREELALLSSELRIAHERQQGLWGRWMGVDRRHDAALKDLRRLAESDLPALIAAGPEGNAVRRRTIDEAMGRIDDHLAGASPYLPPIRPTENQEGLDRPAARPAGWSRWWQIAVGLEAAVLVLGAVFWRKWRSRAVRATENR
jgi:hypothetical protein